MKWLRDAGLEVERLRLSGSQDEGDVVVYDEDIRYLIEAKAEAKYNLAGYVTEALRERDHYCEHRPALKDDVLPIAVIKRRGRPIGDAFIVTTLSEFFAR